MINENPARKITMGLKLRHTGSSYITRENLSKSIQVKLYISIYRIGVYS